MAASPATAASANSAKTAVRAGSRRCLSRAVRLRSRWMELRFIRAPSLGEISKERRASASGKAFAGVDGARAQPETGEPDSKANQVRQLRLRPDLRAAEPGSRVARPASRSASDRGFLPRLMRDPRPEHVQELRQPVGMRGPCRDRAAHAVVGAMAARTLQ